MNVKEMNRNKAKQKNEGWTSWFLGSAVYT